MPAGSTDGHEDEPLSDFGRSLDLRARALLKELAGRGDGDPADVSVDEVRLLVLREDVAKLHMLTAAGAQVVVQVAAGRENKDGKY